MFLYLSVKNTDLLMTRKTVIFAFLFLISWHIKSQTDSTYIKSIGYVFSVRGYLSKDFVELLFDSENNGSGSYKPNNPPKIGLGFSINNTIISLGYGHSFSFMADKSKGKTKSLDFQLHNYSQKWILDLFVQRYKGFYREDDRRENSVLYPDLSIRQYGGNIQYVFNNKKFSYKSSFVHNERQIKSAGTFLLGASIYKNKVKADSTLFYNNKNNLRNFQVGVHGGYAYTWVLKKNWYATIAGTIGVNFGGEKFEMLLKNKIEIYPSTSFRTSMGYNHSSWTFGWDYIGNITFPSRSENNNIGLHAGNIQLYAIKRFYIIPFFGK